MTPPSRVLLTADAERDLEEIYEYIARHDAPEKADHVLGRIERASATLSEFPERGIWPGELMALGIREYREVFFKPHRILYKVSGDTVFVMVIADGRRDMHGLLQGRLLER